MKLFTKKDRSTFPYWAAHLFAFNMVALNVGHWSWKYLFHDFEKPWLKLIWPYEKVQKYHREHSPHHIEYMLKYGKGDFIGMAIDQECSRFSKEESPLTAAETLERECENLYDKGVSTNFIDWYHFNMYNALVELGIVDHELNDYPRYLKTRMGCKFDKH